MLQEDARKTLKQSGVKERMAHLELSHLPDDFYKSSKEFISNLSGEDKEEMTSLYNSIILSRKSKLTKRAEALIPLEEIQDRLTSEEKEFYSSVLNNTKTFMNKIS